MTSRIDLVWVAASMCSLIFGMPDQKAFAGSGQAEQWQTPAKWHRTLKKPRQALSCLMEMASNFDLPHSLIAGSTLKFTRSIFPRGS
jgi:hypothetical protein